MTQLFFSKSGELVRQVCSDMQARPGIVAIDGFDRVGKTTLSKVLSIALDAQAIQVDDFHSGSDYLNGIDFALLKATIVSSLQQTKHVIVDGLCLTAVFSRLEITPVATVYIKGLRQDSKRWIHETLISNPMTTVDLNEAIFNCRPISGFYMNPLYCDLAPYHWLHKPHLTATYHLEVELNDY